MKINNFGLVLGTIALIAALRAAYVAGEENGSRRMFKNWAEAANEIGWLDLDML